MYFYPPSCQTSRSPRQLHWAAHYCVNAPCSFTIITLYTIFCAWNFIFIPLSLTKSYQSMTFSSYSTCSPSSCEVFAQRLFLSIDSPSSVRWHISTSPRSRGSRNLHLREEIHLLNIEFHVCITMYSLTYWILNYSNCTVLEIRDLVIELIVSVSTIQLATHFITIIFLYFMPEVHQVAFAFKLQ